MAAFVRPVEGGEGFAKLLVEGLYVADGRLRILSLLERREEYFLDHREVAAELKVEKVELIVAAADIGAVAAPGDVLAQRMDLLMVVFEMADDVHLGLLFAEWAEGESTGKDGSRSGREGGSEERREGKEWVSTGNSRWSPEH